MKRLLIALLCLGACSPASAPTPKVTTLTVYTAAEADQLPAYEKAFERTHPEVDLVWVRDSTGVVTAKLLAEKAAPRADAIFALAATSLMILDKQGLLAPYTPTGLERLDPVFRDSASPPHWVGQSVWSAAICVNTVEAQKRNLPIPETWADLTKPVYRDAIAMPNPASSGTGMLAVAAWLQMMGEESGWGYIDALDRNMKSYTHSGSKPCKDAARGEVPIGISFDFRAAHLKSEGAPLEVVVPKTGVGWDVEAAAIVSGTPKRAAAEAFLDWVVSDEAMALYAENFAVVAVTSLSKPLANLPPDIKARLAPIDLRWTADNRDRVLAEWVRRYDGKSEPQQ
jgi:iron(III) transport system substrate-binding protein